jgi:hypothetical protein
MMLVPSGLDHLCAQGQAQLCDSSEPTGGHNQPPDS